MPPVIRMMDPAGDTFAWGVVSVTTAPGGRLPAAPVVVVVNATVTGPAAAATTEYETT